jgi:DNA-binding response OmpR family regulator
MATTIKTTISDLTAPVKRQTANVALFLNEELASVPPARIAHEFRKMSRFVPVVVLIPKSAMVEKESQGEPQKEKPVASLNVTPDIPFPLLATKQGVTTPNGQDVFVFGELTVSASCMETHCRGKRVALTCTQFKTLPYLIKNPGRVISRDELLIEVWG